MTEHTYTREELIKLCEDGQVTYDKWMNRDTFSSQKKLHIAKLTLLGGCDFRVITSSKQGSLYENRQIETDCITDDETIWLEIFYDDWEDGKKWHSHYLPTQKKLDESKGGDWY